MLQNLSLYIQSQISQSNKNTGLMQIYYSK